MGLDIFLYAYCFAVILRESLISGLNKNCLFVFLEVCAFN